MAHIDANDLGLPPDLPGRGIPLDFLEGSTPEVNATHHHDDAIGSERTAAETAITPPIWHWLSGGPSEVSPLEKWHHDFLQALSDVSVSQDHEFASRYGALVSTTEHAFRQEERWMEDINFPILKMCQEQHARVLGALHNVHSRVMDGNLGLGREVVDRLLPGWFAFHASTVDATLGLAMQMAQTAQTPLGDGPTGDGDNMPPVIL